MIEKLASVDQITRLDLVDSTNDYLKRKSNRRAVEVVVAREQLAGRGQRDHRWISMPGRGIYLSIGVLRSLRLTEAPTLLKRVNEAVVVSLRRFGIDAQIKEPNDIMVDQQKIAGILIENTVVDQMIVDSIIGVGLNMSYRKEELKGVRMAATSVHDHVKTVQEKEMLFELVKNITSSIQEMAKGTQQ